MSSLSWSGPTGDILNAEICASQGLCYRGIHQTMITLKGLMQADTWNQSSKNKGGPLAVAVQVIISTNTLYKTQLFFCFVFFFFFTGEEVKTSTNVKAFMSSQLLKSLPHRINKCSKLFTVLHLPLQPFNT